MIGNATTKTKVRIKLRDRNNWNFPQHLRTILKNKRRRRDKNMPKQLTYF